MSTFVMVHGAWHGGWCWQKVAEQLEQAGHTVFALDLPGHGSDETPRAGLTMANYTTHVVEVLETAQAQTNEPAILVGHSMGGMVITLVAEEAPQLIRRLVYVAALLACDSAGFQEPQEDPSSQLIQSLTFDQATGSVQVSPQALQPLFYHDCSDEDVEWARTRLVPEPVTAMMLGNNFTGKRFLGVPRVYIECTEDRALAPRVQRQMYEKLPCEKVFSMASSHSPFLSNPEELAGLLLTVA